MPDDNQPVYTCLECGDRVVAESAYLAEQQVRIEVEKQRGDLFDALVTEVKGCKEAERERDWLRIQAHNWCRAAERAEQRAEAAEAKLEKARG